MFCSSPPRRISGDSLPPGFTFYVSRFTPDVTNVTNCNTPATPPAPPAQPNATGCDIPSSLIGVNPRSSAARLRFYKTNPFPPAHSPSLVPDPSSLVPLRRFHVVSPSSSRRFPVGFTSVFVVFGRFSVGFCSTFLPHALHNPRSTPHLPKSAPKIPPKTFSPPTRPPHPDTSAGCAPKTSRSSDSAVSPASTPPPRKSSPTKRP